MRCLPEILVYFDNVKGEPLQTEFQLNIKVANLHLESNPNVSVYLYSSTQDYQDEIKDFKMKQELIDFNLQKNYVLT